MSYRKTITWETVVSLTVVFVCVCWGGGTAMAQQGDFPHEAVANSEVIFDTTPTPDIAMNRYGDGLFTVVWEGRKAGPEETSNIKKQLFSYGRPLGAEDMVNLLPEESQSSPSIDISAGGITAVVWRHVRHNKGIIDDKIQMRLINAGVDFYMWNIVEYGYDPKVCFAGDDVIIVWGIGHGFYDKAIQARRYYSFGVPKDGVFDVYPAHYGGEAIGIERGGHKLDCFENGSFAVSWWERDESTQEEIVWFQVYDSNDDPMFQEPTGDCVPDWSINPKGVCVEGPSAGLPNVLALPDGGVRIAYFDADEGSIKVSCFEEGEENAHLEFSVPLRAGAFAPAISGDIDKTFIAWVAQENGESYFRAARYDMTGDEPQAMEWDQFEGETHPRVSRFCPDPYECSGDSIRVAGPDVSGNFVLAWSVQMDPENFPYNHDVMIRCFDEYGSGFPCGVDVDGDGVLDMYDCDRLNPYLRYDVDQDGVCDEITGGNEADCINACYEVYEGNEIDECIYRCQNLDNCPCFRDECPGMDDPDTIAAGAVWAEYCLNYKWCIDNGLTDCDSTHDADICHKFFANPDQQDTSGNGRGDKCESRPQAHIRVFSKSEATNDISKGYIVVCEGMAADVAISLYGGWMMVDPLWGYPPIVDPDGIYQRTHVGGCGCPPELNESLCRDWYCPFDSEVDQFDRLAWEAIHSIESVHKPNVGELTECADCPEFLDHREPRNMVGIPDWKNYAINKQLLFNHDSGSKRHFFTWDWTTYGKDTGKEDLVGKKVQLRVAWQNPDLTDYVYHESPEDHLVFSDNTLDVEGGGCFGMSIPWEINEPLLVLIEGVWPDPHPEEGPVGDPIPWAVVSDAMTADHLFVSYNQNLQVSKIYPIMPSPGAVVGLELVNAVATAGMLEAFVVSETPAPALFRFGGLDLSGAVSNTLLIGLPDDPGLGWRTAEEIYGLHAAEGPYLHEPKLIFDRGAQRLVVIGDEPGGFGPAPAPGRAHRVWTFDLKTGRWAEIGGLPIPESMKGYTINVDTARNRALLVGSNGATHYSTVVYNLNLSTLQVTEMVTVVSAEGPGGLEDHGASLDPAGQALYVYGGWSDGAPSAKAFKLDLVSRRWEYLGDGLEGPGFMDKPFVMYHNSTNRLWVADRGEGARAQIEYWGLDEHGWLKRTTLEQRDPDDWEIEETFAAGSPNRHLVYVDDTHELPGKLLLARLVSSDPSLGLKITDSSGRLAGEDISTGTENKVAFYGSGVYWVEVVAGEGYDPFTRPGYELSIHEAELEYAAEYTGGDRVSTVVVEGETAYLHSGKLLQAVDLSNPATPLFVGWASLGGKGIGMDMCGRRLCVAHSTGRPNLSVVDISAPGQPVLLGAGRIPGQSRGTAAKSGPIVYTAERNKGVSIWNTANPADPQKMGEIETAGNTILLERSGNLLFVSGGAADGIAVYDVTDPAAPMSAGWLAVGGNTAGMRVDGGKLHVSLYEKQSDWAKCNGGVYCGPGTIAGVYDISDISSPVDLGTYNPAEKPAAEMKSLKGGYVLVRMENGFKIYKAVSAAE